jgi:GntR family transcriptional regulator
VTEPAGRPAYQELADDLRRRIASGEYPVGSAVPSTAKLAKAYGVSSTVVRAAVNQLRVAGLVVGRPGKGVFVCSTPEAAGRQAASVEELAKQVEELRAELGRVEIARLGEAEAELAVLREHVRLLKTLMAGLFGQLGQPVPDGLTDVVDLAPPAGAYAAEPPPSS